MTGNINSLVERAKDGDADALEHLVRNIQNQIHRLAIRMLADPDAAQDATQEILIRVITKLSTFAGKSTFGTWVYRVAINYLLTAKAVTARDPGMSFQAFSDDLLSSLADNNLSAPEDHIMLNELRVRCTMAMLLCLDRDGRAAYVLGEVFEMEQSEAADILRIPTATHRKRLSRARKSVVAFTAKTCGIANVSAPCSCRRRLPAAQHVGRVGNVPAPQFADLPDTADLRKKAEGLEMDLRVAKLQRSTGTLTPDRDLATEVLRRIETQTT